LDFGFGILDFVPIRNPKSAIQNLNPIMADETNPKRPLSEISHLFLSSVREKQTGNTPRPVRKPPTVRPDISIDLTPEEFAQVFAEQEAAAQMATNRTAAPKVAAVIGAHLNGKLFDRVKEYASHLADQHGRVGLIEVDASEFRVMLFERNGVKSENEAATIEEFDTRLMAEALEELSWDVERWILLLPSPRTPEAKALLREVEHWVLLSTCDHDGVVAGYRTLKGLADLHRPRLSLALLDAQSAPEATKVFKKLSSVCQQFLNWPLDSEPEVRAVENVVENLVLCCRATRDKAQLATAPQWDIVGSFLGKSRGETVEINESHVADIEMPVQEPVMNVQSQATAKQHIADVVVPQGAPTAEPAAAVQVPMMSMPAMPAPPAPTLTVQPIETNEVIDLPAGEVTPMNIIHAILQSCGSQMIECPVKPPTCPEASLAVGRDHRIVLLAVAKQGLSDLRAIGRGYQWLIENRGLVSMAMPQFAIDAHQLPQLRLLVDQSDMTAEILQPMLQASNVTVQAYRKLRWGGKTGLLLEAA
jgi:hypothetical protein